MSGLFSLTTEYAIRVMNEIALHEGDDFLLARDLAEDLGLPRQYLSKILQQLVRARLLESTRGRLGGFKLARAPKDIRLFEIVAPFEDLKKTDECILGAATCSDAGACPLHDFWKAVKTRYKRELDTRTLADLARHEKAARRKLAESRAQ
jgi:Rrf2 family protein